jgi:hypothetical protein
MKTTKKACALTMAAALLAAASTGAPAQDTAPYNPLLTRPGLEIGAQVAKYHYEEPGFMNLKGNRGGAVGAYTFTDARRVYSRIDLRASYGKLKYESQGTGTMDDVPDWIIEARAVVGKDFLVGDNVALSPYIGLGYRYLYNDLRGYSSTGAVGYRRYSQYAYAPIGLTLRMGTGGEWVFAPTVEYDAFLGGRQRSKLSDVAPGAPDISNDQDRGRGYRVSLMVEGRRWAFGPWLHYWSIKDSDIVPISPTVGLLEPANWTREYGVELRYRF